MAQYLGLGADEPDQDSERRVASALRRLSEGWTVIHHVSWQSKRRGRQGDGEADFILLHPRFGLLVVEVKGGGIEIVDGRWVSTDRHGVAHEIKNPFEQATASKHALLGWLADEGLDGRIGVGHAVAFPHLDAAPWVGPAGPTQIIWTAKELASPNETVKVTCNHWSLKASLSDEERKRLVNLLAPTVYVRPRVGSQSADAEAKLMQLTAEQVEAFAGLRAARGGLVLGSAGTGKTVLAIARAQQLVNDGFRTLLVCFNELLGSMLEERFATEPRMTACTFHTLCFKQAHAAGLPLPTERSQVWWEEGAPELLVEAAAANASEYDAIIVDEAQDFSPAWLDSLRCLVAAATDAPFFIFADSRQELWGRNWAEGTEGQFTYRLQLNMRNTGPIARRVAAAVASNARIRDIPGPEPIWRDVQDPRKIDREVIGVVERLIDEGFGPTSLVVLCSNPQRVGRLREYTVGPYSFGVWGGRGIATESISRFKGMEAQAAVVVLEDGGTSERERALAYVAMSRARSVLAVVGTRATQSFINWTVSRPS